ncbi:C2HC5 finger protein [Ophiocordyceps sinensis CO18]|uniref:C2HC5 finger protein n=1 Tax=Ophiocordyceps sinensis (strain Co18 / CGMCC 3.14243) TaxID=911162 RepID=T5ANA6_OPHSC|nr:C2HC5 finger protein [Ophiocordyceps sinensis CO18]
MSLAQLSQLLPLPEEELQQVLDYAASLSRPEAATHLHDMLGDSPLAVDFISSLNSHRRAPPAPTSSSTPADSGSASEPSGAVLKAWRAPKKKKGPAIHTPEARKLQGYEGPATTAYNKKKQDLEYIPKRDSAPSSSNASRAATPAAQAPAQPPPKQHATAAGYLISDGLSKGKAKSTPPSRSSTPKPSGGSSTKVAIPGGTPMTGQSTALSDLDAAIRMLEITTNPILEGGKRRKCNCVATRHPLQSAAPNCLSCGKVICIKEGLGQCTFCGSPLLNADEAQAMLRELKDERGRERMAANASVHRKADVSRTPAPFTPPRKADAGDGGDAIQDRIMADEAGAGGSKKRMADGVVKMRDDITNPVKGHSRNTSAISMASTTGSNMGQVRPCPPLCSSSFTLTWSCQLSAELKTLLSYAMVKVSHGWQSRSLDEKLMREMEWNAQPDYEKRRQVISIDLVGGKVVRKMAAVTRPVSSDDEPEPEPRALGERSGNANSAGGAFSRNPLLGALMRPVLEPRGEGSDMLEPREPRERKKGWRRVQDDLEDNEAVILDGGAYGHRAARDEPWCG